MTTNKLTNWQTINVVVQPTDVLETNSMARVRKRTISTEQPPLAGAVPIFADRGVSLSQRGDPLRPHSWFSRSEKIK
jgi:hypothetical protein